MQNRESAKKRRKKCNRCAEGKAGRGEKIYLFLHLVEKNEWKMRRKKRSSTRLRKKKITKKWERGRENTQKMLKARYFEFI